MHQRPGAFPGTTEGGEVDREKLSRRVLGDESAMTRLEALIHPLVRREEEAFHARAAAAGHRIILLDVPLLFEVGQESRADVLIVVTVPEPIQRRRLLARPGMTEARMDAMLARQIPDPDKRRRAHFIIDTRGALADTRHAVGDILRTLAATAAGR